MLPVAVTFVLVMTIILGMYWGFVLRTEEREQGEVRKRLAVRTTGAKGERVALLKEVERLSTIGFLDSALSRAGFVTRPLQALLALAGVRLSVGLVVLTSICAALAGYVVVERIRRSVLLGLLAAAVAVSVPYLVLRL